VIKRRSSPLCRGRGTGRLCESIVLVDQLLELAVACAECDADRKGSQRWYPCQIGTYAEDAHQGYSEGQHRADYDASDAKDPAQRPKRSKRIERHSRGPPCM